MNLVRLLFGSEMHKHFTTAQQGRLGHIPTVWTPDDVPERSASRVRIPGAIITVDGSTAVADGGNIGPFRHP